jgi:predicted N-acetyltransferase YhbS
MSSGRTLKVRHACLDDASGISDVHRSHVDGWYRILGAERYDVPYDSLSLSERWGFGGPWMSAETCAIHLNRLLLQRQLPVVAHMGEDLVGEMELFTGNEGVKYGRNMHVGLLYVKQSLTGRGIGKALVDKAFKLAAGQGCDTITVASSPQNIGFYERCGFEPCDTMVELEAMTKAYDVEIRLKKPPLNTTSYARGMPMPLGRYQSSAYHLFEMGDDYALPEFIDQKREKVFVSVNGHISMLAFTRYDTVPSKADVYGWSEGAGAEELAHAALSLLHEGGVKYANLLVARDDYYGMEGSLDAAVKGSRSTLLRRLK